VEGVNLFIDQMNPDDQIIVVIFNDLITELRPIGAVGEVREPLRTKISNIYAESGTALYQAVIYGIDRIEGLRNEYGDERLYGIVLLCQPHQCSLANRHGEKYPEIYLAISSYF
jgi:hypothetical protein